MKKNLASVLQQDDVQSELLFHQGCCAYYAGDIKGAVRLFEKSLELCPHNQNARGALEQLKQ